jgi:hypothetical protein
MAHHKQTSIGTKTGVTSTTICDGFSGLTVDALIGLIIYNTTTGAQGVITDNDATTVTVAALTGGTRQDFVAGDICHVDRWGYNSMVSKVYVKSARCHMTVQAAKAAGYIQFGTVANRVLTFVAQLDRATTVPIIG